MCELTYRCNLQCAYCYNPLDLAAYRDELDATAWERVLGEAAKLGVLQVHFSGGEPTLRPDLVRLIERAASLDLYTNLITQGTFLDDALLDRLLAAGLEHVQISVQAPEALLADEIAGTRVHARKLEAIARVLARGVPLTLNCVLHRGNHDAIAGVIELAERYGIAKVELANVQFYGWAFRNRAALMPTRAQVEAGAAVVAAARKRLRRGDGDRIRPVRLLRRVPEAVHARLGARVHDGGSGRARPALPAAAAASRRCGSTTSASAVSAGSGARARPSNAIVERRGCPSRAGRANGARSTGEAAAARPFSCGRCGRHRSGLCVQPAPRSRRGAARGAAAARTGTAPHRRGAAPLIIRVLGSAAGGGVPQWNCACANCSAARGGADARRSQSSIALSHDEHTWYLINVSPDVAQQIEDCEPLLPQDLRGTPIAGALFTDANVDHIGGLAVLRQQGAHAFALRSSETVRAHRARPARVLAVREAAASLGGRRGRRPRRWRGSVRTIRSGRCSNCARSPCRARRPVTRVAKPCAAPWSPMRSSDRVTGFRVLFAPVFAAIDDALATEIRAADVAFLDGSFYQRRRVAGAGAR